MELAFWRCHDGVWSEDEQVCDAPGSGPLRVLTQNLWFDAHRREERLRGHLAQWRRANPDIIAVQEATLAMLRPLLEDPWLRSGYGTSATADSGPATHGVVLFARCRPQRMWLTPLPGTMGRRLLQAEWDFLRVAAVHLESTRGAGETRAAQLQTVFSQIHGGPQALLMGDFNFCATSAENDGLDPAFQDLWSHGDGFTLDTQRNPMLRQQIRKDWQARYDRMLLSPGQRRCSAIEQVGTQELAPGLHASDHFGLLCQLEDP